MLISNSNNRLKRWFHSNIKNITARLNPRKTRKDEDDEDWKRLSSNKPPLPFLLPRPENKDKNSDSMTSVHLTPSVSRKLYPILESSETSASSSIRISHSFEKDNQPSSSLHPHPYQKAPLSPSQTKSTPSLTLMKEKDNISTSYIPLFEWPVHSLSSEPQFDPELQFNEPKSKTVFSEMIDMVCRLLQEPASYPKDIYLVFDENEHMKGITFIMQDGTREDYLKFGGSLQYLAPELIDDDSSAYDYEYMEVWSLGVSLFRMLIGKYPFKSDVSSDRELFKRMAMANLDIPKQISEDAKDLIQKMLSPRHSRVSLNSVQSHPWLEEHIPEEETDPPPKNQKGKKVGHLLLQAFRLITQGPYPPPASYYDLAQIKSN